MQQAQAAARSSCHPSAGPALTAGTGQEEIIPCGLPPSHCRAGGGCQGLPELALASTPALATARVPSGAVSCAASMAPRALASWQKLRPLGSAPAVH